MSVMKEKRGSPYRGAKKLRIKLVRSTIGCVPAHRATVQALGLRKLNAVVEHAASPAILGMVRTVSYLLEVEEKS